MGIAEAPYRLADPLNRITNRYAAIIIDIHPSFSLITEMRLIVATDAIVLVEPRFLETIGLMSVIGKINGHLQGLATS
jgi:chromosome partitioning protein